MNETRPGDYDHHDRDDFPDQARCAEPSPWLLVHPDGCCREAGHGGPHHFRMCQEARELRHEL